MAAHCTVRKLCIRTPDKAHVPRMNFVLEDALRTAAFAGLPANGMVYVRRLELGKCSPCVSSGILSRKIDDLLRHARPIIIKENSPEHPDASVVWFPDEASPHRFLIKRLAENHRPISWYWSSAVKGWNPTLTVQESYALILSQVSVQKSGMEGMAFVLEPLLDAGTLPDVLNILGPKEAVRLLANMGQKPVAGFNVIPASVVNEVNGTNVQPFPESLPVRPSALHVLAGAVRLWSVFDPRTMFVSCLVLARMGVSITPAQVGRLFHALAETQSGGRRSQKPLTASQAETASDEKSAVMHPETKPNARAALHRDGPYPVNGETLLTSMLALETNDLIREQERSKPSSFSEKLISTQEIEKDRRETVDASAGDQQTAARTKGSAKTRFRERTLSEWTPLHGGFAGEASEYAGLIFLIPLLKRLGMDRLYEDYPEYLDLKLAERILFRCAGWLEIPEHDPVVHFLGEKPDVSARFAPFTAPPHWRKILFASSSDTRCVRVCRIEGTRGRRLILEEKERLVLGVWSPQNRSMVAPWLEASEKPLQLAAAQSWSVDRLVDNMILAMNRYVRLYADMDISGLIRRPAWIAATRTHLDVSMPIHGLDVRVRMAGLDIDPGWTPWLGKVIQFHYVGGER